MAAKALYVVSAYTSYGMLVYLSVMGYHVNNEYHYVWEPGFQNARMFETKSEAEKNAKEAIKDLAGQTYMIHKYTKKADGKVETSLVS